MSSSISFIHPKKDTLRHRRIEYTITFRPATRDWEWMFSVHSVVTYRGMEPTYDGAVATARLMIETGFPQ